jgi:hypothetical protein
VREVVKDSAEIQRLLALPRRDWTAYAPELAKELTALLRKPGPVPDGIPAELFPIQAVALHEAYEQRGLFAPIGVGLGKTLLPFVWDSQKPLLIMPSSVLEEKRREQLELMKYWHIPNWTKIVSAESVSLVDNLPELKNYNADTLTIDEAHMFKSIKLAARARMLNEYVEERREREAAGGRGFGSELRVACMSGSFNNGSWKDFPHLAKWCLGDRAPVPLDWMTLEGFSQALDPDVDSWSRWDFGALRQFLGPEDGVDEKNHAVCSELERVRRACGRRMAETPGVVASKDNELGTSLQIKSIQAVPSRKIDEAFELLRNDWELPDGYIHEEANQVWAQARQIALGFYYVWNPRPPREWLEPRKVCMKFYREHTVHGDLYSWSHVLAEHGDAPEITNWLKIKDTFKPNVEPVWLCDSVLRMAAAWLKKNKQGILWCEHIAFGEELERLSGVPYYRAEGRDRRGNYILDAKGPIIASIDANSTGLNLQHKWSQNCYISPEKSFKIWEQSLARTHRLGQKKDTVTADVYVGCYEHIDAFESAVAKSKSVTATERSRKKLCYADVSVKLIRAGTSPARWDPSWRRKAAA